MEIRGTDDEFVVLTPILGSFPDDPLQVLDCSCAMGSHRFAGATFPGDPTIRIEKEALIRFVDEVRVLERERHGEAAFECPQLQLVIYVADRAGHIDLRAMLIDIQSEGIHQVAIEFGVDPTALPGILADLEALLAVPDLDRPLAESSF